MTTFAGAFAIDASAKLDRDLCSGLVAALSRQPTDRPSQFSSDRCFLCSLDLGLLPGRGDFHDEDGSFTVLAGDPVLGVASTNDRSADLHTLHRALLLGDMSVLADARGSFAAATFNASTNALTIVTDCLGVRPVYWKQDGGVILFATAMRVLEATGERNLELDLRGLAETAALGYALSDRTPYRAIVTLPPAGYLRLGAGIEAGKYFDWNSLPESQLKDDELLDHLLATLRHAVALRNRSGRTATVFFSGGLDSRCVLALLKEQGVDSHTINMAPRGSLDLALGREAANHFSTRHFEYADGHETGYSRLKAAHASWLAALGEANAPRNAAAVWTGNGGSVGVGHAYLTEAAIDHMANGAFGDAATEYLRTHSVGMPTRVFRRKYSEFFASVIYDGVMDEIEKWRNPDAGRRLHMFLMFNDQRRHEHPLYEDIDLFRFELISPFYDTQFVKAVLSSPIRPFLRHSLYHRWLKRFPFSISGIPWQSYPSHEPCPLPMPPNLRDQWLAWHSAAEEKRIARLQLREYAGDLLPGRFPWPYMRYSVAVAAWMATRLGITDARWILKTVNSFAGYRTKALERE